MRQAIQTPNAPKPIGPYSQAIVEGDFIFLAGQGPTNPATGKVEMGDVTSETKQTFANMKAILEAAGSSLDKVVKCNVYLRDIKDFAAMNEVYRTFFEPPFPNRATIVAGIMVRGGLVEIMARAHISGGATARHLGPAAIPAGGPSTAQGHARACRRQ